MKPDDAYAAPRILLCGETAISVEFGNDIDLAINQKVLGLLERLEGKRLPGVLDLNPTYRSLFIQYDPWQCSFERLLQTIDECLGAGADSGPEEVRAIEIPVCYGGEFGPDMEDVSTCHGLTEERVVELHCAPLYHVYMIGFTLGFPYLGGLDAQLYTPRKKEPRNVVPAGSVGIADRQTGIYPIESPGGWQLIGRTPLRLFDLERADPFFVHAGDRLRFRPITREEFESFQGA